MVQKIRYRDKKSAILQVLREYASREQTITYAELGKLVGIPTQGPWKPVLDIIANEERSARRPDITFVVLNKSTGLPGQIGFSPARKPTPEQREYAAKELDKVFRRYWKRDGK